LEDSAFARYERGLAEKEKIIDRFRERVIALE
jgi:hypothetical protein